MRCHLILRGRDALPCTARPGVHALLPHPAALHAISPAPRRACLCTPPLAAPPPTASLHLAPLLLTPSFHLPPRLQRQLRSKRPACMPACWQGRPRMTGTEDVHPPLRFLSSPFHPDVLLFCLLPPLTSLPSRLERDLRSKQASLPAEPPRDDPEGINLAVRLPAGGRYARRFRRSDPLQASWGRGTVVFVPTAWQTAGTRELALACAHCQRCVYCLASLPPSGSFSSHPQPALS